MSPDSAIAQILDLARWAPSGDNTQPWRFEVRDERNLVVHGFDTRDHCVYDLDGRPSQISLGALLETMSIAATAHGLRMHSRRRTELSDTTPTFDVHFARDDNVQGDPLLGSITQRTVQRRAMSTRPLTVGQKQAIEEAVGPEYRISWLEGFADRFRAARLMFGNAKLRLTLPEAYRVHREVIEWDAQYSEDRVPDQALGVDAVTLRLMRFVMASWQRVAFFNNYLAGTVAPRLQMDFIPGLACAAHFSIYHAREPRSVDDFVAAGRAVQRCWLTASRLGLFQQPEMTPLIFCRYAKDSLPFTAVDSLRDVARDLAERTRRVLGANADRTVWMGRLGTGPAPVARSLRQTVDALTHRPQRIERPLRPLRS